MKAALDDAMRGRLFCGCACLAARFRGGPRRDRRWFVKKFASETAMQYTFIKVVGTAGLMDIKPLLDKVKEYLPDDKLALVEKAYLFALESHENQLRLSGEPFITHPLETAMIVTELQLDETSLAAALLHDVPEDCGIPFPELEKRFGAEVTRLVEGVTRLDKISAQVQASGLKKIAESEAQVESLRKMFGQWQQT